MAVDPLEQRVQDYAHDFFAVYVKQEYENIFSNWERYFNDLVKCATVAFKNHERVLTAIRAEQRAQYEFAMLAFSLITGPVLSWISGHIQYTMVPKLFGTPNLSSSYVVVPNPLATPRRAPLPKPFGPHKDLPKIPRELAPVHVPQVWDPSAHSKEAAKMLGDFVGSGVRSLGINPAFKAMAPSMDALDAQIKLTAESRSLEDFEAKMKNALSAAKSYIGTGIVNFAGRIKKDFHYGKQWLEMADRQFGRSAMVAWATARDSDEFRFNHAASLMHRTGDEQRRAWARDPLWYYFGNNPPHLHQARATNALEAKIWALWIRAEQFKTVGVAQFTADGDPAGFKLGTHGKSNIPLDKVLDRLVDLGIVFGRTRPEMNKAMKRWNERRNELGLLSAEVTNIDYEVDTEEELQSIQKWAVEWKLNLITGIPRTIESLDVSNVPMR